MFRRFNSRTRRGIIALAAVVVIVPAAVRADDQLDRMVQQTQAKKQTSLQRSKTCGPVTIKYETIVDEGVHGPSVDFYIVNNGPHAVAVKFGYRLRSTMNQEYTKAALVGTSRLNAGKTSRRIGSGVDIFPGSVDPNGDHPQINDVAITPLFVAPNVDAPPPNMPANSYVDIWHDYHDIVSCNETGKSRP